ncbi:MAG: histidine--tRNA ligase [Weeksellaceae bacterium]
MNNVQTLKGFRDFLGQDARKRQWLKNTIATVFERFGFEPLETPTLEYEELLLGKYGTEADKLIYSFEDRGARRVALRYDQTVPTARIIAQNKGQLPLPYKRYQIQPVWRADKPQKGRYREFVQCDADIIGTNATAADAEILAVYAAIYAEIGIESLQIRVNDREALILTLAKAGITPDNTFSVIQSIDKLDKKSEDEVIAELESKGITAEIAQNLLQMLEKTSISEKLQSIIDAAVAMGVKKESLVFTPTLARGLDYYTGLIFEGIVPEYESGSVGGGGRYDNLIEQLVGVPMSGVGFGLGYDRTLEAAEILGKVPAFSSSAQVLVTIFNPELASESMKVTNMLRESGVTAECYLDATKKLDVQLKYANAKGIPYVVVIGPDEAAKVVVKLKDMEKRIEKTLTLIELIKTFQNA